MKTILLSTVLASLTTMIDDLALQVAAISAAIASAIYIGRQVHNVVTMAYAAFKRTYDGVAVLDDIPAWMEKVNQRLEDGAIHMSRLDHRLDALQGFTAVRDREPGEAQQVDVTLTLAAPESGSE